MFNGKREILMVMVAIFTHRSARTTRMLHDRSRRRAVSQSSNMEARLSYVGHLLMENRHKLIVDAQATVADRFAERDAATTMLSTHCRFAPQRHRTVGADKAYGAAFNIKRIVRLRAAAA